MKLSLKKSKLNKKCQLPQCLIHPVSHSAKFPKSIAWVTNNALPLISTITVKNSTNSLGITTAYNEKIRLHFINNSQKAYQEQKTTLSLHVCIVYLAQKLNVRWKHTCRHIVQIISCYYCIPQSPWIKLNNILKEILEGL